MTTTTTLDTAADLTRMDDIEAGVEYGTAGAVGFYVLPASTEMETSVRAAAGSARVHLDISRYAENDEFSVLLTPNEAEALGTALRLFARKVRRSGVSR